MPMSEGTILSAHRRYHFSHRQCEYGTGAEIIKSVHAIDKNSNIENKKETVKEKGKEKGKEKVGVKEKGKGKEKEKVRELLPQCGLVEISAVETRARLQQLTALHHPSTSSPLRSAAVSPRNRSGFADGGSSLGDHVGAAGMSAGQVDIIPHKDSVLRFLDQAALKTCFARGWPAVIIQEHNPNANANMKGTGSLAGGSLASKKSIEEGKKSVHVHSIVQQGRLRLCPALYSLAQDLSVMMPSNKRPGIKEDALIVQVRAAMDVICAIEKDNFNECHNRFLRQDTYPLPVSGGLNVEKCLLAISADVLSKMHPSTKAVCKVPSSFVVRFIWENLEREATSMIKPSDVSGKKIDPSESLLSEYLTANMSGDSEYFIRIVRSCFEIQLLVEYVAYSRGLLDGAER